MHEGVPGVRALGIGTLQDVGPQCLGYSAGLAILALPLLGRALGAVPQEQQPALLLGYVLPIVRRHLKLEVLLAALIIATCKAQSLTEGSNLCLPEVRISPDIITT